MKLTPTPVEGIILIEPRIFSDSRGSFFESYSEKFLADAGIEAHFVQDNQSVSKKNVVRGLHLQLPPHEQGKLVRVIKGSALDVAVDIRRNSPTFGRHYSVELNDRNNLSLWIPPGFAHGFSVLEDETVFTYKVTACYHPASESGIVYNDIDLAIDWKIAAPLVSEKDKVLPSFRDFMAGR